MATDGVPQPSRFALCVLVGGNLQTHRLPERGVISIGRGADNDIVLDDPGVSRSHALIHVAESVEVEDLGSSNGTRVRALNARRGPVGPEDTSETRTYRLDPHVRVAIAPGDAVHVGSVLIVIRPQSGIVSVPEVVEPKPGRATHGTQPVVVDPVMRDVFNLAERVAPASLCVLLLGETGVGKEVVAETIHRISPRSSGAFLRLNCGALPEALLESQLFGHERGAFTGAAQSKPGLLEVADGGTVFLDEVGELPPAVQVKLLRVLEDGQLLRVGALRPRKVDVRFIAATNRDLEREVVDGAFRGDLFYRLAGVTILVPPLRERPHDIEALARAFVRQSAWAGGRGLAPNFTPEALELLHRHRWPGNVRELRNVVERALLLCGPGPIAPEHLSLRSAVTVPPPPADASGSSQLDVCASSSETVAAYVEPELDSQRCGLMPAALKQEIERAERERILYALEQCAGNQTQAARLLGISRRTLIARLDTYGMPRPRKKTLLSG